MYRLLLSALMLSAAMAGPLEDVLVHQEQFNTNLYKSIASKNPNDDVFFSSLGIHTVMSMLYSGADGDTKKALADALLAPDPDQTAEGYDALITSLNAVKNVTLKTANKIYLQKDYKLQEAYGNTVRDKFHCQVDTSLNFVDSEPAANTINSWVSDRTNGKIKKLFEGTDFDADTRMVLVNAIYFKGNWQQKFDKQLTRTEPFYVNGEDQKIDVQMMHRHGSFRYKKDDALEASVLELPFDGDDVTMTIVLPTDNKGISNVEKKIEELGLHSLGEGLQSSPISLSLPKFKLETSMDLKQPLTDIGLGGLFTVVGCNLSKMIDTTEPLYVSKAIQKAFVEVNEAGAEAAAATGGAVKTKSALIIFYEDFYVDHPFLVMFKKGNVVLFYGKIMRPISGDSDVAPRGEPTREPKPPVIALFNNADN